MRWKHNNSISMSMNEEKKLIAKMRMKMLAEAAGKFIVSGFAATPPETLTVRQDICKVCPEWDAAALNNTGRCKKCGCSTWAKLRMATERCPVGKWEAISSPSVSPVSSVVNPLPTAP